jgi:hypothetical protein
MSKKAIVILGVVPDPFPEEQITLDDALLSVLPASQAGK